MSDAVNLTEDKKDKIESRSEKYDDPSGVYPNKSYYDQSSTNQAARGLKVNKVYTGGAAKDLDFELKAQPLSVYPYNQVRESPSGHVTEIDDTPGAERMLFRHRTGSGVEMRADGTVIISSTNNTVRVTCCDEKVIVDGDAELQYNGNVTMKVAGDFDLVVGGNFNVTVSGDQSEDVHGNHKHQVRKNYKSTVTQVRSDFTGKDYSQTVLANSNNVIKGQVLYSMEGGVQFYSGEEIMMTAAQTISQTSPSINIGASSLTLIGDSGTIGGENIIMYNYNMYTGHSITATDTISTNTAIVTERVTSKEFVGSLTGNADTATQAGSAGTAAGIGAGGSAGSKVTGTPTPVDTTATVLPDTEIMTDYLKNSSLGVRIVKIDPGGVLYNSIDRSEDYGGISSRELTPEEVRSKLRDQTTLNNAQFIGSMIAEGKLNPEYIQAVPPNIGRSAGRESTPRFGSSLIGNRASTSKRFSK